MHYKAAISDRKNNPIELWKLIHSVISSKPSSTKPSISKINVDDLVISTSLISTDNLHIGKLQMDLRKAFDTVSHPILLSKLYHYGICGPAFSLLESYLSYRYQFVSLNNCHSSSKPINIGVYQGSILGPLLFLIYVNDHSNSTSCNPCLFADDTCLVVSNSSFSSLEQRCNAEFENLKN